MPLLMVDTLDTTPKMPSKEFDFVSPRLASDLGRIFGEKMKWTAPFAYIEANYAIAVGYLQHLCIRIKEIFTSVGVCRSLRQLTASNLRDGMAEVDNAV
jgi:hypothetical protein